MMPGIAVQPGFPLATPAARNAPAPADDRFSHALRERPKAPAQADGKTDQAPKHDAAGDSDGVHEIAPRHGDNDDKIGQPAHTKEGRESADNGDRKKNEGDRDGNALPPHMMAERTLARQWPDSSQAVATKAASTAAGTPASSINTAAPATGIVQANPLASAIQPGTTQPGTVLPTQGLPAQLSAPAGKDGGTGTAAPMQAKPADAGPVPNSVSVVAATAPDADKAVPHNTSFAFMAKVAAAQHEDGPGGSPQGAGGAASTSAPDAKPTTSQILRTAADQGSGNADADPDGQAGGGTPDKAAQNAAQLPSSAKGYSAATPLPTAQMVPSSGSAASFAGALQQGGVLARYAADAAAALAAGTPANALPAQSLSIQLRPVELGSVTAHLKYAGNGLSIDIEVETSEAHRRLSNDSSDIVKSLQSLGFQVDKVTVRQALAQSPAQPQPQGQSNGQGQGQPMGRDGFAGGFASQGGSPFSMSGQSGGNGHRQGSESRYENASERGIGMVHEATDRLPRRGVFI